MTHDHQNPGTWQGKLWWTSRGGEVQFLIGPERSGMEICGLAGSKYYIQRYSYNWTIGFMISQCWKVEWEQIWQYNNMLFIDKTIFVPNWQVIFSPPTRRVPIHEREPVWWYSTIFILYFESLQPYLAATATLVLRRVLSMNGVIGHDPHQLLRMES